MKEHKFQDARELAFHVLSQVSRPSARMRNLSATELLSRAIEASDLSKHDEALATELVYSAVRRRLTLDWVIERFSGVEIKRIEPTLLQILRLGVLQLLYIRSVPEYAAVNESVELARAALSAKAAGFANAVLRKVPSDVSAIPFPPREKDAVLHLSIVHSHPAWLIRRWVDRFGEKEAESICLANNAPPPITGRVNTLKTTRDELAAKLAREGVEAVPLDQEQMFEIVNSPKRLSQLVSFRDGLFYLQDVSATIPARLLAPRPGQKVLDLCSAPGGKATHIAELMGNRGLIVACDIDEGKMSLLRDNIQRLGTTVVRPLLAQGTQIESVLKPGFDRVLIDAPCSNTGVLRRRVEARWRLNERDLKALQQLQLRLLSSGCRVLKEGGLLVYSTCSIEREENENVVRAFLKGATDFVLLEERNLFPEEKAGDGGYVARLGKF
ncbi:MAG: 16S rRNA (cytosine(967)-C(5))-methyltransferase RsmB [bacterium]|nr:16S rRNA (cytosine(967)-C(5))-methyltransferase RsmB [bacterium]